MERQVAVTSIFNRPVVLFIKNYNFEREFQKEGTTLHVPFDILFDGLSEYGVRRLFSGGFLTIKDEQTRLDLGLEASNSTVLSYTTEEILQLFKQNDVDFEEVFKELPIAQRTKVIGVAIENSITDFKKCQIIKKYSKIDISEAVKNNSSPDDRT